MISEDAKVSKPIKIIEALMLIKSAIMPVSIAPIA
jgi:hypothetical protein